MTYDEMNKTGYEAMNLNQTQRDWCRINQVKVGRGGFARGFFRTENKKNVHQVWGPNEHAPGSRLYWAGTSLKEALREMLKLAREQEV